MPWLSQEIYSELNAASLNMCKHLVASANIKYCMAEDMTSGGLFICKTKSLKEEWTRNTSLGNTRYNWE